MHNAKIKKYLGEKDIIDKKIDSFYGCNGNYVEGVHCREVPTGVNKRCVYV